VSILGRNNASTRDVPAPEPLPLRRAGAEETGPLNGTSAVRGQPRTNTYWHPEKLLRPEHDENDKDEDDDADDGPGAA
jgi:hypothetical protein